MPHILHKQKRGKCCAESTEVTFWHFLLQAFAASNLKCHERILLKGYTSIYPHGVWCGSLFGFTIVKWGRWWAFIIRGVAYQTSILLIKSKSKISNYYNIHEKWVLFIGNEVDGMKKKKIYDAIEDYHLQTWERQFQFVMTMSIGKGTKSKCNNWNVGNDRKVFFSYFFSNRIMMIDEIPTGAWQSFGAYMSGFTTHYALVVSLAGLFVAKRFWISRRKLYNLKLYKCEGSFQFLFLVNRIEDRIKWYKWAVEWDLMLTTGDLEYNATS